MVTQSSTPAATRVGRVAAFVPRVRSIAVLVVLSFAVLAASAQAHTGSVTAACKTVTFHWTAFAPYGSANGGLNTPTWSVVFTPTGGLPGAPITGHVSFPGSTFSLTVTIPGGNGKVVASSAWTTSQTRDQTHGFFPNPPTTLTISDCAPPPPPPPPPPPATPTLATTASGAVALGGSIHDTALLSGGSSPTGTITFNLYSASDTTCSTALNSAAVPVNGAGSYDSPEVTPPAAGSYQWVATYSGDAGNTGVANACNDLSEQATVATQVVEASCVPSPVVLRGLSAKVRRSLSVHVTALGVKSVTFYLDGRKLATLTKPKNQRFTLKVSARKLGYGRHKLAVRVTMRNATCASAAAAGAFVKVKPITIRRPEFTG